MVLVGQCIIISVSSYYYLDRTVQDPMRATEGSIKIVSLLGVVRNVNVVVVGCLKPAVPGPTVPRLYLDYVLSHMNGFTGIVKQFFAT